MAVQLPAVLLTIAKVFVPATSAALAGNVSLASVVVTPTMWVLLTTFQFASTALTVTLKEAPAVCALGVPVLPLAVPGAAVSPGSNSCNFAAAPALTVVDGLVFAVFAPSVMSVAVTVAVPAVLNVTLKFAFVPAARAAFAGSVALASLEVRPTVSVTVFTKFQFASTAFTVTVLIAVPAVCALGAPVFPVVVPGVAVSPGINSCSFANAPTFTVVDGLVLAVFVTSVMSVAVTVRLPAVFSVTLKVCVPDTMAALAGKAALASLDEIPTVCVLLTTFQFASTAFTVTLNAVPAVCAVGVPVLPVEVPGAAVSPGIKSCSFAKAPTFTVVDGLVLAVFVPSVMSVAVTV